MNRLLFYPTQPQRCSYLPDRLAVSMVADPRATLSPALYAELVTLGFRRSGVQVYAPHCPDCRACVPTRVPVAAFRPNRSQRRALGRNADLQVVLTEPHLNQEYFDLYRRYLGTRHPGGGMDEPTPEGFADFLVSGPGTSVFAEFRVQGRLLGVAVTDVLANGLSAVYTFFEPDEGGARGLGTYAVLWQIEEARRRGLPHLYLGYWIEACAKMRYKARFRPIEGYLEGEWRALPTE